MRYYYYGETTNSQMHGNSERGIGVGYHLKNLELQDSDLVIEEDTVYEIDRECLKCRRKHR